LENCVLRAAILAPGKTITPGDINLSTASGKHQSSPIDASASLHQLITRRIRDYLDEVDQAEGAEPLDLYAKMVAEIERPLIELTLDRAGGNQVRAARILGLNRNTLRKKITELRIVLRKGPAD
jgi:two-component system nitrogen regulation response regulator GlnG